jgi:hypothetical protein
MIIPVEVIASVIGAVWGLVLGLGRYPKDLINTLKGRLPDVFLMQTLFMVGAFALGCMCWMLSISGMLLGFFDSALVIPAMVLASVAAIACFFFGGNRLAYLVRL